MKERRKLDRRNFSYYMRVTDERSGELIGHLTDISTGGFKLDCQKPLPLNVDYRLRIELSGEIASKSSMSFGARSRWCEHDRIDPTSYNAGFQITDMAAGDAEIFSRMFEMYGSASASQRSNTDYLWK